MAVRLAVGAAARFVPMCCSHLPSADTRNSYVFGGLWQGEGGVGGYHHLFPKVSKLIAFDFATPSAHWRNLQPSRGCMVLEHTFNQQVIYQRFYGAATWT